jgi:catechol 2,3-dioxygenase-like lactoylglutathione lyase family enzyme
VTIGHGGIVGGLVSVPDLGRALEDYEGRLGLELVDDRQVGESLATAWGCPAVASSRMATLRPQSGAFAFVRLVEQPIPVSFRPTTSFGWAAYEMTVQDVFGWPRRLAGSGFRVVGEPREIPGMPYFVAMQVIGTGGEMLYLNETRGPMPNNDLPPAKSLVDHIFIVVVAARDRTASVAWYRDRLRFEEGETHVIPYTMINKAFGLPSETRTSLTMIQIGRTPIAEINDYPTQTVERPRDPGRLPPGNALVTLAVDSLEACRCSWIAPPTRHTGPGYAGRLSATTVGAAGELVELVEIG